MPMVSTCSEPKATLELMTCESFIESEMPSSSFSGSGSVVELENKSDRLFITSVSLRDAY